MDIATLSKQGCKESYPFLCEVKRYFDKHYNNQVYDAVFQRREAKGTRSKYSEKRRDETRREGDDVMGRRDENG